ncbi:MAG: hypothetical protein JJ855_00720 [Rhodospirillales bacterium]|nr:hypothetical protein [Rhodospirillales bacterium]
MNIYAGDSGERRQHERLDRAQLYLRIGGHTFHTVEWSYGGFVVEDRGKVLPAGALLRIDGLADEETYRRVQPAYQVDIRARVLRVIPEKKQAVLTCLKLDDAAYRVLSRIENSGAYALVDRVTASPA